MLFVSWDVTAQVLNDWY